MRACVRAYLRVCACACARAWVGLCMCAQAHVRQKRSYREVYMYIASHYKNDTRSGSVRRTSMAIICSCEFV